MRPVALVALVAVCSSGAARAEDKNEKLDITVVVDPVVAILAAMVKVSGKTTALGEGIAKTPKSLADNPAAVFIVKEETKLSARFAASALLGPFTRKRPGGGNVVDYVLAIKACNPGCK